MSRALLSLLLLCLSLEAQAEELTARHKMHTARSLALAQAMVASASGSSAVWHNPAAISSALMYTVDLGYAYRREQNAHQLNFNLLDSRSNPLVGAQFALFYERSSPQGTTQDLVQLRQGLSLNIADNFVSLGATAVYNYSKWDGKKNLSRFTFDLGLMLRPIDWIHLGLSLQNIIVGDHAERMPRMISAGLFLQPFKIGLGLMFDASFNLSARDIPQSAVYALGIEYLAVQSVPLRFGYRFDQASKNHSISGGLGYRNLKTIFGFDLAYQHIFAERDDDIFSASLGLYF